MSVMNSRGYYEIEFFNLSNNAQIDLSDIVSSLNISDRNKKIVKTRLDPIRLAKASPSRSLDEVGEIFGISRTRVGQIMRRAYRIARKQYEIT